MRMMKRISEAETIIHENTSEASAGMETIACAAAPSISAADLVFSRTSHT